MAKCICTNDLNKLVTVMKLKSGLTQDAGGHIDKTDDANWIFFGKEWAQCVTAGTREVVIDDQVRQFAAHEWTIRWSNRASQYTTGMRLKMSGRVFSISEPPVNQNEQNEWIIINTTEVPAV